MLNFRDPIGGWNSYMQGVVSRRSRADDGSRRHVGQPVSEEGHGFDQLMKWGFEGKTGWGEDQDVWVGNHFVRMLDALRNTR